MKMVDLDWKAKMVSSDNIPNKSPRLSNKLSVLVPSPPPVRVAELAPASDSDCSGYEHYLRLPELQKLWSTQEFPGWRNESVLKPALQALEITFRFVSIVMGDPRPYANRREWRRRLESLTNSQIELIALLVEDEEENTETRGTAPVVDLAASGGKLVREGSCVWKLTDGNIGGATVVSQISEASLLPRLATWQKSEDVAQKILYSIECKMFRCPYKSELRLRVQAVRASLAQKITVRSEAGANSATRTGGGGGTNTKSLFEKNKLPSHTFSLFDQVIFFTSDRLSRQTTDERTFFQPEFWLKLVTLSLSLNLLCLFRLSPIQVEGKVEP